MNSILVDPLPAASSAVVPLKIFSCLIFAPFSSACQETFVSFDAQRILPAEDTTRCKKTVSNRQQFLYGLQETLPYIWNAMPVREDNQNICINLQMEWDLAIVDQNDKSKSPLQAQISFDMGSRSSQTGCKQMLYSTTWSSKLDLFFQSFLTYGNLLPKTERLSCNVPVGYQKSYSFTMNSPLANRHLAGLYCILMNSGVEMPDKRVISRDSTKWWKW